MPNPAPKSTRASGLRFLSGSELKLLALVAMTVDHYAAFLVNDASRAYLLMRTFGRIAFPVYCFLLVEGFLHTRDRLRYGFRLLAFALVSELPWNLAHTGTVLYAKQNVFFTLLLGYIGLWLIERLEKHPDEKAPCAFGFVALVFVAALINADYGLTGVGFILLMYLLSRHPVYRFAVGTCVLPNGLAAGAAFVPIALYNGRRGFAQGRAATLAFYIAYPVQFLVFWWLRFYA